MSVTIACVTGAKKGEGGGGEENALSNAFHAGHMYLLIMSDCLYALRLLVILFFPHMK